MENVAAAAGGLILVVDDEAEIRQLLRILLNKKGYQVMEAANGEQALQQLARAPGVDLILMDIMMPGLSGLDACRRLRVYTKAPVLFLTARNTEGDKEAAYDNGGDDFLPKPFSQAELMMKVGSLIRRYRVYGGEQRGQERFGKPADALMVDAHTRRVRKREEEIRLTDKEMELFLFLMNHRGEVLDVKTLYEAVWKSKYMPSSDNNIMVYIQRLRKKLEDDPANPVLIRTVYGRGYQID
jgi:DNA-binding response OmpR family regulator